MVIPLFYLHVSDVDQRMVSRSRVRLCVKTPTPKVRPQNLRACKTWNVCSR